jgi:type IX secretion system substrate protein
MKSVLLAILTTTILMSNTLSSAEIIPVWNRTIEGKVQDMKFLKGQNEILVIVEGINGQIQRRNPNDGELIHSFPIALSEEISRIALTPDSTRFVLINGSGATLRGLDENFTIEKTFYIERPKDSVLAYFTLITIDPIRTIAYVTTSSLDLSTKKHPKFTKVIAYNYETGEHIKDLTEYGEDEYTAIEVSHNGKYLATLNDNKAYLKVWDLESMEQIINEPLFDENSNTRCEAEDIYFSKIDDNVIYYSGLFSKKLNSKDIYPPSIYTFNITSKEQKLILPNDIYGGWDLIFLDNESRIMSTTFNTIGIINQNLNSLEWYNIPPDNIFTTLIRYSEIGNYFIGASGNDFCKFLYDRETSINPEYDEEVVISPNPTTNTININLNSNGFEYIRLSIVDLLGNEVGFIEEGLMNTSSYQKEYDVSDLPPSMYFIRLEIGKEVVTKQFIKE